MNILQGLIQTGSPADTIDGKHEIKVIRWKSTGVLHRRTDKCVTIENGSLIFRNSYFHEEWYSTDLNGQKMILSNRMMSTYINVLADHGFFIEKLIEETDREKALASKDDFGKKALMLPTVFILKARKC